MHVYFTIAKKQFAPFYGDTAIKEQEFFSTRVRAGRHGDVEACGTAGRYGPHVVGAGNFRHRHAAISTKKQITACWRTQSRTSGGVDW